MKKCMLMAAVFMAISGMAMAAEPASEKEPAAAAVEVTGTKAPDAYPEVTSMPAETSTAPEISEKTANETDTLGRIPKKTWEIQADYMKHWMFKHRHIDNYSVHAYRYMGNHGSVSWYQGVTFTVNDGYRTSEDDDTHRDSDSWGIGPSVMGRWEKHLTGKLYGSIDATGSLLFYNKAFPAGGRAYGFMWRGGPRLTYKYNENNALSVGYLFMHCSNGMKGRNPGYNGKGFSISYSHLW